MIHSTLSHIVNPGSQADPLQYWHYAFFGIAVSGFAILATVTMMIIVAILMTIQGKESQPVGIPGFYIIIIVFLLAPVGAIFTHMSVSNDAHVTAVKAWLAADYGINTTSDTTENLINGEPLHTASAGSDEVISLKTSADGSLYVVKNGDQVIRPRN